eukprot:11998323-Alexandrium_andersonii.AAC.1
MASGPGPAAGGSVGAGRAPPPVRGPSRGCPPRNAGHGAACQRAASSLAHTGPPLPSRLDVH